MGGVEDRERGFGLGQRLGFEAGSGQQQAQAQIQAQCGRQGPRRKREAAEGWQFQTTSHGDRCNGTTFSALRREI